MAGSTRRIAPSRPAGSPVVRRSWLRRAPPSAVGRRQHGADAARRIAARVDRRAVLPVVDEVEAGAVPAAHVERAVGTEGQAADRVARVLLAPVLDQHLLRADHHVAGRLEPREAAGDHAAVGRRAGRRRAAIRGPAHRPPARRRPADGGVEGVEDVDPRVRREVRRERETEQSTVPEVVDLRPEVGEHGRRRVRQVVEDLDDAALLGHEDPAVWREAHRRGLGEPGEDDLLLEAGRQRRGRRGLRRRHHGQARSQHRDREEHANVCVRTR